MDVRDLVGRDRVYFLFDGNNDEDTLQLPLVLPDEDAAAPDAAADKEADWLVKRMALRVPDEALGKAKPCASVWLGTHLARLLSDLQPWRRGLFAVSAIPRGTAILTFEYDDSDEVSLVTGACPANWDIRPFLQADTAEAMLRALNTAVADYRQRDSENNTRFYALGERCVVVQAVRDIAAGEEVTVPSTLPDAIGDVVHAITVFQMLDNNLHIAARRLEVVGLVIERILQRPHKFVCSPALVRARQADLRSLVRTVRDYMKLLEAATASPATSSSRSHSNQRTARRRRARQRPRSV